ncbi:MAG: SAM-dependent methyltransferase [Bdellovibrio sp. CG10_big_fil_rev_8_21_14_0_10_47_8]|nr:MAG: SAM-dependent methyltransferase [Bdellovibrio sp. CG10_big_fil_rev_8_21_14_0_10_47_8]
MSSVFDSYGAYYDLLYGDKNYAAEVEYIDNLLKRYGKDTRQIIELGAGTGIHGSLLAEKGYKINGIELSSQMVARARVSSGFSIQQGDIRSLRLNQTFDAAISLFHVLSYQVTNEDILETLKTAHLHLRPGAIFIFDFWYSPAVYSQRPESRVKTMENAQAKITRWAEPKIYANENRVDVQYKIHAEEIQTRKTDEFFETHSMRHFSLPEIDLLATATGFERIQAEEFLTAAAPSENTWGVCVVLRRRP